MTSSHGKDFRITGPLLFNGNPPETGEFPAQRGQQCEVLVFYFCTVEQAFELPVIRAALTLMQSHSIDSLQVDISQIVAVNSATAHPHEDPDGTIHNLGMVFKGKPAYAIIKMTPPAPGKLS